MNLKKIQVWLLSIISGLLLSCGWYESILQLIVFVGFVPLLIINEHYNNNKSRFSNFHVFIFSFITFLIWNGVSTWWVWNASPSGVLMAVVFNSIFMSVVFSLFRFADKVTKQKISAIIFVSFWLAFEYLHLNWELSWTWLTLGNGLSENIKLIQWYEYTGVLGGSLWILSINYLMYKLLFEHLFNNKVEKYLKTKYILPFVIILPIIFSFILFYTYKEVGKKVNVVVVQPNIDPFNDKFSGMTVPEQLNIFTKLALSKSDSTTDYVVGPETCLPQYIWEDNLRTHPDLINIKQIVNKFPNINLVVGASTARFLNPNEPLTGASQLYDGENKYYESYNTALQLSNTLDAEVYHKSKLVLGVEKMPFAGTFKFLNDMAIELGGSAGSLGIQKEAGIFHSQKANIAPVICYESIYGEYVTNYIKKGAELIFVITNDGWWKNTPGYRQHLSFSSLRAIECRKDIARSANTGISCFINQKGEISQATKWWTPDVIKSTLFSNNVQTFYVKHGDYIGVFASFVSVIIIIITLFLIIKKLFH